MTTTQLTTFDFNIITLCDEEKETFTPDEFKNLCWNLNLSNFGDIYASEIFKDDNGLYLSLEDIRDLVKPKNLSVDTANKLLDFFDIEIVEIK